MSEQDSIVVYDEGVRLFVVPSGARVEISDENYVTSEVVLDTSALIDNDLEGFLDLLSMGVTDTELLMDINYRLERLTFEGMLVFDVTGDVSEVLQMEEDRNGDS